MAMTAEIIGMGWAEIECTVPSAISLPISPEQVESAEEDGEAGGGLDHFLGG